MNTETEQVQIVEEDDDIIVLHISWVQVAAVGAMLVGVGIALLAGLWVGRRMSVPSSAGSISGQPAAPVFAPQQPARLQPVVPARSQPQIRAQPVQGRSSAGVTTSIGRTPNVGDDAPDFVLKNLDGQPMSLADFKGRPVLINFWATWCGPCRLEMPLIEEMYQQHQEEGFVVLAVDVEESITVVKSFVESMGLTFPILLDYKGEVSGDPYRVRAFPTSYFIGRDGKVVATHRGMMTRRVIDSYMTHVLASEPAE